MTDTHYNPNSAFSEVNCLVVKYANGEDILVCCIYKCPNTKLFEIISDNKSPHIYMVLTMIVLWVKVIMYASTLNSPINISSHTNKELYIFAINGTMKTEPSKVNWGSIIRDNQNTTASYDSLVCLLRIFRDKFIHTKGFQAHKRKKKLTEDENAIVRFKDTRKQDLIRSGWITHSHIHNKERPVILGDGYCRKW